MTNVRAQTEDVDPDTPGSADPGSASGRRLAAALQAASEVVLDGDLVVVVIGVTANGPELTWANAAFERVSGYTVAAAQARDGNILSPGYRSVVLAQLAEHAIDRESFTMTFPMMRPDGQEVAVPVTVTPHFDAQDSLDFFVAVQLGALEPVATPAPDLGYHSRHALETVARVSDILSQVGDDQVLDAIVRLLTRHLYPWCGFFADDGVLKSIGGLAGLGFDRSAAKRPRGRSAADPEDPVGRLFGATSMRRVRLAVDAVDVPGSPSAQLVDHVRAQTGQTLPEGSELLVLPLLGRGRTLGLMAVLVRSGDEDVEASETVLELVARRVGLAMDHSQLYQAEHRVAEALQRAMLPEQDQIEGLDVWTYYAPNAEHAQVGGDWYDVVHLDQRTVGTVVGDVVGHDVEAAAAMGQLRSVVRAFATELVDPGTVLTKVDRILENMRMRRPASLVYASLTPCDEDAGTWSLAYSRAGHLPGLWISDGEVRELDGAPGRLMGFGTDERQTATVQVKPGDAVMFYTDGLVERRSRTIQVGVGLVREILADVAATSSSATTAADVGEALLSRLSEPPEDDIAVVIIRFPDQVALDSADARREAHWRLATDVESVRMARRLTVSTCEVWGLTNTMAAELVVAELITNAVVYGRGSVGLTLKDTGDGLRIEVQDDNPVPPTPLEVHPARVGGYGMHIVTRLADWGWRPSGVGKVVWARVRPEIPQDLI
ncbi:SpoIIE family protein phosphatase [Occultella aeris]|uniref:Phosphoserine phosphatase RsbP n=1 Tax=Occultella aeris TaxID=2761496 RepID=A0A7M4DHB3_9MICO|nr:SpoIIE family protein phosphatase [Occultella aeris]VZO36306.1 Phosphoserine phosphatase RsbP [Occultella aeris]